MRKVLSWLNGLLLDERYTPSAKRFTGIVCALTLCGVLIYSVFTKPPAVLDSTLISTIGLLAFGCLGLSSVDKFTAGKSEVAKAMAGIITPEEEPK